MADDRFSEMCCKNGDFSEMIGIIYNVIWSCAKNITSSPISFTLSFHIRPRNLLLYSLYWDRKRGNGDVAVPEM